MLNIPDEVKALFKSDSVFKNFHVHFPNGENADLNNDDVVSESVEFTESICSQQSFRFGLTEASELKFTAVNIPNVRGATLEAALEIDIETLGSEWAEQHAPSGTESFLDPQVCTYGSRNMYRVPYGRFIVDTCPRNHEAMWKREITAYTERMDNAKTMNPFQISVMDTFYPSIQTYAPYVKPLALSLFLSTETDILNAGYSKWGWSEQTLLNTFTVTRTIKKTDGSTVKIEMTPVYRAGVSATSHKIETALFTIDWGNFWSADTVQLLADRFDSLSYNAEASGYGSLYEMAQDFLQDYYMPGFIQYYENNINGAAYIPVPKGSFILYPYVNEIKLADGFRPCYLSEIRLTDVTSSSSPTILPGVTGLKSVSFTAYYNDTAEVINESPLSFSSTLETTRKGFGGVVTKMYSFANAFSLSGIVQGYLELQCRFGSPARAGGMEITALDNSAPVQIVPAEYSELWYDETTISPIGYVQIVFKDEKGEDQDITVQIGEGNSVYDLRDNEVLNNMVFTVSKAEAEDGITIESKLLAFLNSVFTPNIPDLSFVPIELTKQGLPYLEAGDAIEITTGDGQTVPSFILRQTIKGIQFLTASVESANGEAVEMVES